MVGPVIKPYLLRLVRFDTIASAVLTWDYVQSRFLGRMKVKDVIKLIKDDGWYLVRTRGSHRQFKHRVKAGLVTIAGKASDDLAPGTLNSILKQAGLE